jgi:hypothetical protein
MPDPHDHHANARNIAIDILRKEKNRTPEMISDMATKAVQAATIFAPGVTIDIETLTAELRHLFSVQAGDVTILDDDPKGHFAWLPSKRAEIQWKFWTRYVTYLERDFGMPPDVVNNLHDLTDKILERLEEPQRAGKWDRRGMVVGSVQSGKTANYVGLINKAIDAGYKLVIVLAGIHSNLRAQTQLRVDEGVLGFDTQKSRRLNMNGRWVGVGRLPGDKLVVHSLTSSAERGDFSKQVAESIGVMIGGDPVVLVVKKNSKLLSNLMKWVRAVAGSEDSDGKIISDTPLLLIDDEADNASINIKETRDAKGNPDDVSAINRAIREILFSFEKSAYVGYTATPFANIFINPSAQTEKLGEDIFPRSFIINVKAPSNYVGPAKVFGLDGDVDAGVAAQDGLPIVRDLHGDAFKADYMDDAAFPQPHKITHVPTFLPPSLREAVRSFILVCAVRRARGQERKHNSMLVHVTRFVPVQEHASRLLRDELMALQKRIEHGDGARRPTVRDELRGLWEREFVPVSKKLGAEAGAPVTWEQVDAELHAAAAKIDVLTVNSSAGTPLDYKEHEAEGRSVIAVGGNKLSRGLTLEGLSISYFLRASQMYDTLMQMGRWFGYRPGYLDLCRLFTTRTLIGWYRHIALAEAELRREFDYMVAARLTPMDYGLRVRTHPEGMVVTAMNKMCHSQKLELSWAGVLVQTTQLPKDERIAANLAATEALLSPLGAPIAGAERETRVWRGVRAGAVAQFVEALRFPPEAARASGPQLAEFIRKQTGKEPAELTTWTVTLVSNTQAADAQRRVIAGHGIGLIERSPENQSAGSFGLIKGNILSPADEARDFRSVPFDAEWCVAIITKPELWDDTDWLQAQVGRDAWTVALDLTLRWQSGPEPKLKPPVKGETKRPNGRVLRVLRRRDRALLLIYPVLPPEEVEARDGRPKERTGLSASGDAIVGVALSFPASDTVLGVEYRVNKLWDAEVKEDAEYDD